jgi:acyl carrier protein
MTISIEINYNLNGVKIMASIKDTVLQYVKNEYLETDDDREITYDTPLISGGIVDSFSMVSLKVFLETKYNIQIPDAKASPEAFDSVNNIVNLLKEFNVKE